MVEEKREEREGVEDVQQEGEEKTFGPNVVSTACASFSTPCNKRARQSLPYLISFPVTNDRRNCRHC